MLLLHSRGIDIWLLPSREKLTIQEREMACSILSVDEIAKSTRFVSRALSDQFLQARMLVRNVLSFYVDISPLEWVFVNNFYGRPFIHPEIALESGLNFSLSHTNGLIALAVSMSEDVAVDVESVDRILEFKRLAAAYFSKNEYEQLLSMPADKIAAGFWSFWTLKESYVKARSIGLSVPLDAFSFDLGGSVPSFSGDEERLGCSADGWRFRLISPTKSHMLAICVGPNQRLISSARLCELQEPLFDFVIRREWHLPLL